MSLLCSSDCAVAIEPIVPYCDPCGKIKTRQSGGSKIHFIKCSYEFADLLDPAEWVAAIAANEVFSFPIGKWELPAPAVTNEKVTGCGLLVETSRTYAVPFETYCSAEDGSDFDFWSIVGECVGNFRVILESCDGIFYLCDAFYDAVKAGSPATAVGSNPGLEFSFSVAPYENREGDIDNLVKWQATLDIKKAGLIKGIKLPGISSVL